MEQRRCKIGKDGRRTVEEKYRWKRNGGGGKLGNMWKGTNRVEESKRDEVNETQVDKESGRWNYYGGEKS